MKAKSSRAPYLWHLRAPFADKFDRTHWWEDKTQSAIEPIAALYELTRRHPEVGSIASGKQSDLKALPESILCLQQIGMKSWPTLCEWSRDFWFNSVGKMKGVDCRPDIDKLMSIKQSVEFRARIFKDMVPSVRGDLSLNHFIKDTPLATKNLETLKKQLVKDPVNSDLIKLAFERACWREYESGHWLFSVAPDLTLDEARSLFEREYRKHQKRFAPKSKQRARNENWLSIISDFENAEVEFKGAKSQVFSRYRRALDGVSFA